MLIMSSTDMMPGKDYKAKVTNETTCDDLGVRLEWVLKEIRKMLKQCK